MHAFGIGYGVAPAGCLCATLTRWAAQTPAPISPAGAAGLIAFEFAVVTFLGWLVVWGPLLALKDYDAAAAFRAADPGRRKSFAAGLLSGLAAVGAAVLVHVVIQPSGQERDLNTVRAAALSLIAIGLGWAPGMVLFLRLFRPRPAGGGP